VAQREFYGKNLGNKLPAYQGGGEMIKDVSLRKLLMLDSHKFEAGTPNVAGGIVLGTAVDYMNEVGFENIQQNKNLNC
jgi:cysteine desulfurase/selenocysteine lyase